MAKGLYRTHKDELGACVCMDWGTNPETFLTRDTYVANRHEPPFDELPTREEYEAQNGEA